jgi:hypothetical protein
VVAPLAFNPAPDVVINIPDAPVIVVLPADKVPDIVSLPVIVVSV